METRGATAVFDATSGHFTLYSPSQAAHVLKTALCAILGVGADQLRVLSGDVGGAFGLKTPAYPEHAALLIAARKLGRPVHWMATRSEAFLADQQARDQVAEATLALDDNGRFLALRVAAVANLGAYLTPAGATMATNNFHSCFPEMYDIPHLSVGVRLAFTNTAPTGPYRGAGRPESNYVMERLVDAAARQIGIDPVDLRRRNLIAADAMPYRSASGNVYDSGEFEAALDAAIDLAGMAGFEDRRANRRDGAGCAGSASRVSSSMRLVRRRKARCWRSKMAGWSCGSACSRRARDTPPCFAILSPPSSALRRRTSSSTQGELGNSDPWRPGGGLANHGGSGPRGRRGRQAS